VAEWNDIPANLKDSTGLYYGDYGGYMTVGYDSSKFGTITSLNQLLGPKFKNAVALNGNPTEANAALQGVMMTSLAEGGSPDNIAPGVDFFKKLKAAGNFNSVQATATTIKSGATPVVINWDYLNLAAVVGQGANWKLFIPPNATLGAFYDQAINKGAPHPAAARLWEEYLYAALGQNDFMGGFARPVEFDAMQTAGTLDAADLANLPKVTGTPQYPSPDQQTAAQNVVTAKWASALS
jgi:putative spermidine/putrescine transport system substrate-binding protein